MMTITGQAVTDDLTIQALRRTVRPLTGKGEDYDRLLELIGDAQFVLLACGAGDWTWSDPALKLLLIGVLATM